jgi:hypothetical protein
MNQKKYVQVLLNLTIHISGIPTFCKTQIDKLVACVTSGRASSLGESVQKCQIIWQHLTGN